MDTLVLSAAWEPVARVPWTRAVTLLYEKKVETVEHYDEPIRSPSQEWKKPSVIRFIKVAGRRKRAVKFSRENVYARDRGTCQYCNMKVAPKDATYDHVLPRSQGGPTRWENVVIACVPCNQRKGGKTPSQAGMHLLSTPVKPKKLPETQRMKFAWHAGMPETWKSYIRDTLYWRDELVSDSNE